MLARDDPRIWAPGKRPSRTKTYHSRSVVAPSVPFVPRGQEPVVMVLTCTSTMRRCWDVWTARMSVRASPSRLSEAAQPSRASIEQT